MSQKRSEIPVDPTENLARMTSILARYEKQLEKKKGIKERVEEKLERIKKAIAEDDGSDVEVSAQQEQILFKYEDDLEFGIGKEVKEKEGQVAWAKRQVAMLERLVAKKDTLKHKPFAALAASATVSEATEDDVEDTEDDTEAEDTEAGDE